MVNPVQGSGNVMQKRGKLAAYKADLLAHKDGTGFRQRAESVDMHPPLAIISSSTDVQGVLEDIENFLLNDDAFASIGDNINSFGMYNVGDPGLPTVESCFAAAFASARISFRGGIIQLKAGQYNFTSTVTLPVGTSLIGELGGTILNATTANPIFKISSGNVETIRLAPAIYADGSQQTKLYNLSFFDAFGDTNPYLNLSTIIQCERGSHLRVERCTAFGKIGPVGSPPPTTRFFISYDTTTLSTRNSILQIENCQVSGVQQVVDFDIETGKNNKLLIKNNRFWVSGRLGVGVAARYTSAVAFKACNANLSHNQIWFGLDSGTPTLQTIETAFACYDPGSTVRNLTIVGNQGFYTDSTLADQDNRLIAEDNNGLSLCRAAISGNVMGGASDSNNWFIVVGDGSQSVGDINGEFAIQNIVKYFYEMNAGDEHGGIIIYVKPGSYTIDDETIFETPATGTRKGLPVALIGISDNGNFPTINFDVAAPTVGGQEMMFSHHIENIYFNGGSNYYKIMVRNAFANPDLRTPFFRNIIIKNCAFNNCSIGILSSFAAAGIEYMKDEVFIEDCQFSNTAVISNLADPTTMIAIKPTRKNGNIYIKRCYTVYGEWRGNFFAFDTTNQDTKKMIELEISDCIYTTLDCTTPLSFPVNIQDVKSAIIKNNIFDASASADEPSLVVLVTGGTNDTAKTELVFTNNYIKGGGLNPPVGLGSYYFDAQTIMHNTFEDLSYGVYCLVDYNPTAAPDEFDTINMEIDYNRCIIGANSYGFVLIGRGATATSNTVNGKITVNNNTIDCQDKAGAVGYSITSINNVYGIIVVGINSTDNISVEVSKNNINQFKGYEGTSPEIEVVIGVVGAINSKVCKNDITFTNASVARDFFGIYVSPASPSTGWSINNQMTDISENSIMSSASAILLNEVSMIYVRNTDNMTITKNRLRRISGSITWFINGISTGLGSTNGVITDNILGEALSNGGIKYKGVAHNNVRSYVARNKNQTLIQEIDCTDFKQYGYNRNTAQPYSSACLMWKSNAKVMATSPTNRNVNQLHILRDGINGDGFELNIATWTQLKEGLYYTNAYGDSANLTQTYSPCMNYAAYNPGIHYKHQIIIPLRLPNFIKITKIEIPIFWKNMNPITARTVGATGSLICGNDTDNIAKIEYITDNGVWGAGVGTTAAVTAAGGEATLNLYTNCSVYVNPTRNTTGSGANDSLTTVNCYVVLGLFVAGVITTVDLLYFAIPHAKVTYIY